MPKLNDQQRLAVNLPADVNCLINAGAGSGKTATLSKRVYRLIHDREVSASSLLILTFTNKAAYEMKQRIINQFAENEPDSLAAKEILSAHIQTFDSFSQYLVTKYASRLGISKNISVANESILNAKKREILNQILLEKYTDHDQGVLNLLYKTDTKNDRNLIKIILDLDEKLSSIVPDKRKDLIEHYDERRLSHDFFQQVIYEFVREIKSKLIQGIYSAYFHQEFSDEENENSLADVFSKANSMANIPQDYRNLSFDFPKSDAIFKEYVRVMELSGSEFLKQILDLRGTDLFAKRTSYTKKEKEDYTNNRRETFSLLKGLIGTSDPKIKDILSFDPDMEKEYRQLVSFKEDIHVLLDIVQELDQRLFDYKKVTNSFTFSDISGMALALMTEPKYNDIAEEVSSRFTYIMVDEYQDTNDAQEEFLDSIKRHGHLFVVGDPKQSIYAFRNSNVKLFNAREADFESKKGQGCMVIPMNTNYRSVPKLLSDINHIFLRYMTKEHGDIDYTKPTQQLMYDETVNLYPEKDRKGFGISRIILAEDTKNWFDAKTKEALAIIDDIQEKMNDPEFMVYDLSVGKEKKNLRRARYSDFAILIRKKKNFAPYQELFNNAGIPLNNLLSSNLREIDAIILLESLIKAIGGQLGLVEINYRHVFASIARSYVYGAKEGYDDSHLHEILSDNHLLYQDPITEKIQDFCKRNLDRPFSAIFLDMLSSFSVISKLNTVGNAEDNISKIESLYQIILAQENTGEGLAQFVTLFNSFRKYSLSLDSKTVLETEDAVNLLTIHASKGLEYPVVYMPITDNAVSKAPTMDVPDYDFSKEYGILLPDYDYTEEKNDDGVIAPSFSKTIANLVYQNTEGSDSGEVDEHVRLIYVALTRAKDSLIFVGNDNAQQENLYRMLDTTPHYPLWNLEFIQKKLTEGVLTQKQIDALRQKQEELAQICERELTKASFRSSEQYEAYRDFFHNDWIKKKRDNCLGYGEELRKAIFIDYLDRLKTANLETKIKVYSTIQFNDPTVTSVEEFARKHKGEPDQLNLVKNQADAETKLDFYFRQFEALNLTYFGLSAGKEKLKDSNLVRSVIEDHFFASFTFALDDFHDCFEYECYPYIDDKGVKTFHRKDTLLATKSKEMKIQDVPVEDKVIEFPERIKRRASKQRLVPLVRQDEEDKDEEKEERDMEENKAPDEENLQLAMERGTYLHKLLELADFKKKDTSYIVYDSHHPYMRTSDRALIERVLLLPLFDHLENADIYQEYDYYDALFNTNGSIDLLIRKDGQFHIVDYKTNHIDDPAYLEQLKTYKRNIMEIFHVDETLVHTYLLSITKAELKQID